MGSIDDQMQSVGAAELSRVEFTTSAPPRPERDTRAGTWLQGNSDAVRRLLRQIDVIAASDSLGLLIVGEPGSGQLDLASHVHQRSPRRDAAIQRVDARDEASVEVLHRLARAGHDDRIGHVGTAVILDIDRATPAVVDAAVRLTTAQQAAPATICGVVLLSRAPVSTLRETSMAMGQLLGRGVSAMVTMPALRDRAQDIPVLARLVVHTCAELHGRGASRLSEAAMSRLLRHDYPGNCRELHCILEQAVLRATGDRITERDLPLPDDAPAEAAPVGAQVVIKMPGSSLRDIELQAIRVALQVTGGRLVRAAELLGVTRHALRRKLEKYGLSDLRTGPPSVPSVELVEDDNCI